jgi:hypothetical protein
MGEMRNICKILIGKPKEKRLLGQSMHRWEDEIKMDLREIGWDGVHWIQLIQDRHQWLALVNMIMNLQVP